MKLLPLEPRRVRRPSGAYGWVDMRVVTQGHLEKLGTGPALTYLFLCSVGDRAGLSFWSRERMGRILGLGAEVIQEALDKLVAADLIARQGQVAQVLPVPNVAVPDAILVDGSLRRFTSRTVPEGVSDSPDLLAANPEIDEAEVRSYLPQARAQMARFLGSKIPAESALLALSRSLAVKDKSPGPGCSTTPGRQAKEEDPRG